MISLVGRISESLVAAASQAKMAEVAFDVFSAAKARGDTSTMDRALSYATPAVFGALKKSAEIREDIEQAKEDLQEEVKQQKELNKTNQEKTQPPDQITLSSETNQEDIIPVANTPDLKSEQSLSTYSATPDTPVPEQHVDIVA